MRNIIIRSFRNLIQNRVYTLNEGLYVNGNISKGYNDFICNSSFKINSVERISSRTAHNRENTLFTIGDYIQDNKILNEFFVLRDKVILRYDNSPQFISIEDAVKYVAPVATLVEPTVIDFSTIEQTIIREYNRPIRLEKTLRNRRESLLEFLIVFFKDWNNEKRTIYADDLSLQTDIGKRRSLGDIYMICKYYYPRVTLKEVIKMLYVTLPDTFEEEGGFRTCKCNAISKRVWHYVEGEDTEVHNIRANDEYGNTYNWYKEQFNT